MQLTELQAKAVQRVRERLSKQFWFTNVCIDAIPNDKSIKAIGIDNVIEQLISDTDLKDNPDSVEQESMEEVFD